MGRRQVFIVIYACSGAAGLIYEIVWTRLLSLVLGHSTAAAGTVLAAFMGGLAVGAVAGGSIARRVDRGRALRLYSGLELGVAACAVALPIALRTLAPLLARAYGEEPGVLFAIVRLAFSLTLVFVPAAAMGATFPLAVHSFADESLTGWRHAGGLYAANTVGAAVGALVTGFVLVAAIGLRATTLVGVGLNVCAAAGAWLLATGPELAPAAPVRTRRPPPAPRFSTRRRPAAVVLPPPRWLPATLVAVSGFAALVYEVTFTRALAVAFGPTTYAFAAMLTAFVTGLAIGAAVAARVRWTDTAAPLAIGLLMLAAAALASAAGWFTGTRLPLVVAELVADRSAGTRVVLMREAAFAVGVLLPVSIALGALFPLAIRLAAPRDEPVAHNAAAIYGANTIGAVLGSLAGAFVLVPRLGLQQSVRAAGALAIGGACLAFLAGRVAVGRRVPGLAAAALTAAVVVAMPAWDVNLLSGGGYKYAPEVRDLGLDLATGLKAGRLLYYREGSAATVSVRELAGTRALAVDGKVDASNGTDMLTQKLLAHLPLLLHADPRRVCIIGLGSGVTLGAALRHGVGEADVIEISPEVVRAASFFAGENGHALDDPRTRLIVSDGRSHLLLTSRQYDVIISEPSNPWMAGVAALFTREFFLAARARLAPGGVVCQWAHTYDIADADLRSIAATFASVFPNGTMWLVGDADVLFVATNDAEAPRLENVARAWTRPGVAADLAAASVADVFSLLSLYVAGPAEVRQYGTGALVQTDDRMRLEFSGPAGVYDRRANTNASTLRALVDRAHAPQAVRAAIAAAGANEWMHLGRMLMAAHAYSAAFDAFAKSIRLDPDSEPASTGVVDAAGSAQRIADAQRLLESIVRARPGSVTARTALARLLAATGAFEPAAARAEEVVAAAPADPRGVELLASILADAGDLDRLRPLVARMRQTHPDREDTWYYGAVASFLGGNLPDAIARAERVVAMNPRHVLGLNLIGSAHAQLGHRDEARRAFRAALEASPQEASTYANLGLLEMQSGNADAALAYFSESLTLDPHGALARANLAAALAAARQ